MIRVVVESPYAGDVERNLTYLRLCLRDCLRRGEAPFASHALYTQPLVLDDTKPEERKLGIDAGFEWALYAERRAFYVDLGWSSGMAAGRDHALSKGTRTEIRSLKTDAPDLWQEFLDHGPLVTGL